MMSRTIAALLLCACTPGCFPGPIPVAADADTRDTAEQPPDSTASGTMDAQVDTEIGDSECDPSRPCAPGRGCETVTCIEDRCLTGVASDDTTCDDEQPCTEGDRCSAGQCVGLPKSCGDEKPCTLDACQAETGVCIHDTSACECELDADCYDGDQCTADVCGDGTCVNPIAVDGVCDDGKGCTDDDRCTAVGECIGTEKACDDGRLCSVDACEEPSGTCHSDLASCECAEAIDCDDENDCTEDACDDGSTCSRVALTGTPCSVVTGAGTCVDGACVPGMAYVPAGEAWIGCNPATESVCLANEGPQRLVTTERYLIDLTEVTVERYAICVQFLACSVPEHNGESGELLDFTKYGTYPSKPSHPVNFVTRTQASAYCSFVGKRLCSEAEWEKAARGGCDVHGQGCQTKTFAYPWGNEAPSCETAWSSSCGSDGTTASGSLPNGASPYGVLEMVGNVREWVRDCYHEVLGSGPESGAAWIDSCEAEAVFRSSAFKDPVQRTSQRVGIAAGGRSKSIGIRCCKDAP